MPQFMSRIACAATCCLRTASCFVVVLLPPQLIWCQIMWARRFARQNPKRRSRIIMFQRLVGNGLFHSCTIVALSHSSAAEVHHSSWGFLHSCYTIALLTSAYPLSPLPEFRELVSPPLLTTPKHAAAQGFALHRNTPATHSGLTFMCTIGVERHLLWDIKRTIVGSKACGKF